jgi:hypothetical protein
MTSTKYYKFLDNNLTSYHNPNFYYPTPILKNGEWIPGDWIEEKDSETSDQACGKGLHVMKVLNPKYYTYTGNCYEAEGQELLAEDNDKARFRKIRLLRPVSKDEIFKQGADLSYAKLSNINLSYADLSYSNLSYANLYYANLYNANLSYADLSYANLYNANLSYADLYNANLSYADLSYSNLSYADLYNANLSYADLSNVKNIESAKNLDKAYWNEHTKIKYEFKKLLNKDKLIK